MKSYPWRQNSLVFIAGAAVSNVLPLSLRSGIATALLWGTAWAVLGGTPVVAHEAGEAQPAKSMRAVRLVGEAPQLDGKLDEDAWKLTPVASNFIQKDPDEGKPASERTAVRVLYDDEALYVGVMCYDRQPDQIVARLTRRDDWVESDRVSLNINPHHDHQSGFFFSVGPAGWIMDGVLFSDTSEDNTWDGVWEVETAINDSGWVAEYRIPYHVLRFSSAERYTWGINVIRNIVRKQERADWIMTPRGENGWVSRFGHLEGIEGITPPRHLELIPFGLGSSKWEGGNNLSSNFGADLRYGLTPNISLNATFNPDFGQVEADPAVLNLGVFETFFRERRPFFVEGADLFRAPGPNIVGISDPARLFHSRRIGRSPGRFDLPDDSDEISRPDGTTIWGAAKLSGKTSNGLSFGLVDALTGSEKVRIEEGGARRSFRVEPLSNYLAARLQQDLHSHSTVGATLTAVNGDDFSPSYVASADGHLKWKENAYRVFGRLSGSRSGGDDERESGYEAVAYFSKFSGTFGGQAYVDARSKNFEANDLGFMDRNNRIQSGAHVYAEIQQPWALARRSGFNLNAWQHWNFDQLNLKRGVNFNTWHNLKNYWWLNFGVNRTMAAFDDLETRGGPPLRDPAGFEYWWNIGSDDSKKLSFSMGGGGWRHDGGDSRSWRLSMGPNWQPTDRLEFSLRPSYRSTRDFAQWIENADEDGDGADDRYVFGELDNWVLDMTLRAACTFTPRLSLQLYMQPFVTAGDYGAVKALARPRSYAFEPYDGLEDNPDFHSRSLRSNVVLRWEFSPGSTFFAVWSQSRSKDLDAVDPDLDGVSNVLDSFGDGGQNTFLIKCNYWLGI
jgi:hypothetical protein